MQGRFSLKITEIDEYGKVPTTETWEYNIDNTMESIDDWVELFDKILAIKGFCGTLADYFGVIEEGGIDD